MVFKENIKEAFRSLVGAKQRSLLALLGIVIGIGSVIAMVSVGTIVQKESLRHFLAMGTDILEVTREGPSGGTSRSPSRILLGDIRELGRQSPDIVRIAPYGTSYGYLIHEGKRLQTPCLGVTESFADVFRLPVENGRFISDLDEYMFFCVLSSKVAGELRKVIKGDIIGKQVLFQGRIFTVLGVVGRLPMSMMRPMEINEGIMIPITTASRLPSNTEIRSFTARLVSQESRFAATSRIQGFFAKKYSGMNLRIKSPEDVIAQMEKQMRLFTLLLGAIGSISLVVGGVGVMNVMLVSVSERRKEIGIRRALGARRADIQAQFLVESILLSIVGGALGILLGIGSSYVACRIFNWEFLVSSGAMLLGVGVSCAVGIFFGFYPARQASKLDPIVALRMQ